MALASTTSSRAVEDALATSAGCMMAFENADLDGSAHGALLSLPSVAF